MHFKYTYDGNSSLYPQNAFHIIIAKKNALKSQLMHLLILVSVVCTSSYFFLSENERKTHACFLHGNRKTQPLYNLSATLYLKLSIEQTDALTLEYYSTRMFLFFRSFSLYISISPFHCALHK